LVALCSFFPAAFALFLASLQLGFSTHRQKRMRQIKKAQQRGTHDPTTEDPFELFISQTDIRWTYYKDSHKVLGQTFGMLVLQVTPPFISPRTAHCTSHSRMQWPSMM